MTMERALMAAGLTLVERHPEADVYRRTTPPSVRRPGRQPDSPSLPDPPLFAALVAQLGSMHGEPVQPGRA
jgi:hypothetical protein